MYVWPAKEKKRREAENGGLKFITGAGRLSALQVGLGGTHGHEAGGSYVYVTHRPPLRMQRR
jgi:hypothetical protein